MNASSLEQLIQSLKEEFQKYSENKTFGARTKVRKVLQQIKSEAQSFRKWLLEDLKPGKKKEV